jgi:hypothetical protein
MAEAERVARDIEELGIDKDEISVIAGNEAGAHDQYVKKPAGTGAAAASAASFGGGVGIVAGLIALAIPGVGPIIAGGALATVLTGLGVGAAAGGLIGAFTNMGISHEEAPLYEEAVRRGGVVVAVHVNDPMEPEAARVMQEHGARDLRGEADAWRASGWKGSYSNPHPYPSDSWTKTHEMGDTERVSDAGGSRASAPQSQSVAGSSQTSAPDLAAWRNVRSFEYQRPAGSSSRETGRATSRQASSTTPDPSETGGIQTLGDLSGGNETASGQGNQFPVRRGPVHLSDDDPAYVFGNRWASDPNYNGRSWTDVESSLRSSWEGMGTGPWDTFRDRVRRGFEAGSEDPNAPSAPENKPGQRGF